MPANEEDETEATQLYERPEGFDGSFGGVSGYTSQPQGSPPPKLIPDPPGVPGGATRSVSSTKKQDLFKRIPRSAIVVAGVLILLGGGGLIWRQLREPTLSPLALPVPLDQVPTNTVAVYWGPLAPELSKEESGLEESRSSTLSAAFCGGWNAFGALRRARNADPASASALGFDALGTLSTLSNALNCGKEIALHAAPTSPLVRVTFMQGTSAHSIVAVQAQGNVEKLPGMERSEITGAVGWCKGSCGPKDNLAVLAKNAWIGGESEDVRSFVASPRISAEAGASSGGTLARMGAKLGQAEAGELRFRPTNLDLSLPCVLVAPKAALREFLKNCLPDGDTSKDAIALKLRAVAVLRDRPETTSRIRMEHVFWARSESDADAVFAAVRDYASVLKNQVHGHEAELARLVTGAEVDSRDRPWQASFRTWLAAIASSTVEQSGEFVRWKIDRPVAEDDVAMLRTVGGDQAESKRAQAVITTLLQGKAPTPEELSPSLSKEVSSWMMGTPATPEDCRKVVDKAKGFSSSKGFDQFAVFAEILDAWDRPEMCSSRRLTAASRQCHEGAADIASLAACPVPVSPAQRAMFTSLQGSWRFSGIVPAPGMGEFRREEVTKTSRGVTVVFSPARAEMGGGEPVQGDLTVLWCTGSLAKVKVGNRRWLITHQAGSGELKLVSNWTDMGQPQFTYKMERTGSNSGASPANSSGGGPR